MVSFDNVDAKVRMYCESGTFFVFMKLPPFRSPIYRLTLEYFS